MLKTSIFIIFSLFVLWNSSYCFAANINKGKTVYDNYCQVCHGIDGHTVVAGVPDFRFGDSLMQPDLKLFETLQSGKGVMPAFRGVLSEQEIFDVIGYLRTLQR